MSNPFRVKLKIILQNVVKFPLRIMCGVILWLEWSVLGKVLRHQGIIYKEVAVAQPVEKGYPFSFSLREKIHIGYPGKKP